MGNIEITLYLTKLSARLNRTLESQHYSINQKLIGLLQRD